jgi:hypothetical protein
MTKLIDQINALKATATERAAAKAEQDRRDLEEANASEIRLGVDQANVVIPDLASRVMRVAEDGEETQIGIPIQTASTKTELTLWEAAYASTITQHFEDEGLTVEQRQAARNTATGKRYNTTLYISW